VAERLGHDPATLLRYYARVHAGRRARAADNAATLVTPDPAGRPLTWLARQTLDPSLTAGKRTGARIPSQVGAATAADRIGGAAAWPAAVDPDGSPTPSASASSPAPFRQGVVGPVIFSSAETRSLDSPYPAARNAVANIV